MNRTPDPTDPREVAHTGGGARAARRGAAERERWNERHRGALRGQPAPWVSAQRPLLAARSGGRALDVACGLGRHAVLLAELGFEVDAVDVSDVAIHGVREETRRRGLPITPLCIDLTATGAFPRGPYDVIVDAFFLDRSLFAPMAAALAPEGLLIFETFGAAEERIGPRHRLGPGELRTAFPTLRVLGHREGRFDGRHVQSLVATRPALAEGCPGTTGPAIESDG